MDEKIAEAAELASKWLRYKGYSEKVPGISATVFYQGEKILDQSYGMSDIKNGEELTEDHLFHLASITKYFTSTAVALLSERDEISLEEKVKDYISWFDSEITLKQLLTHQAEVIREVPVENDYWVNGEFPEPPLKDLLKNGYMVELDEESFKYSNLGYAVIGKVIEEATGQKYRKFIQKEIFESLDMEKSFLTLEEARKSEIAKGHSRAFTGMETKKFEPVETFSLCPAAGLLSTTEEIARSLSYIGTEKFPISKSSLENLREVQEIENAPDYGIGRMKWEVEEKEIYGHSGGFRGYESCMGLQPEKELAVAVAINQGHSPAVGFLKGIFHIFLRAQELETGSLERTSEIEGFYRSSVHGDFIVQKLGGGAVAFMPDSFNPLEDHWNIKQKEKSLLLEGGNGYGSRGEEIEFKEDRAVEGISTYWKIPEDSFSLKELHN